MNIAIIPARGGSKRIPRKNIKLFAGKPMIAYAISAAKLSKLFDHILISTDDGEIADIAKQFGAEVPFIRPNFLADDHTATAAVINHAINIFSDGFGTPKNVCCIYPSVPLLKPSDIVDAYSFMRINNAESCYPVVEFTSSPQRALKRKDNGKLDFFYPDFAMTRTQDLEKAYFDSGQFYWGTPLTWKNNSISSGVSTIIPHWRIVDIDTIDDWKRAELIYQSMHLQKNENR